MKKLILFTVILSLLASFAYAQPGYGGRGHGNGPGSEFGYRHDCNMKGMGHFGQQGKGNRGPREGMILRLADEIGLDDAQIDKIKTANFNHQMAMVDARADAQKAQIEVNTLMRDDDASEAMVMGAIDKASKAKANIAKLRYSHREEIQSMLTDEQLDKLDELRKTRFEGRWGRFGDDDDDRPNRGRRFGR